MGAGCLDRPVEGVVTEACPACAAPGIRERRSAQLSLFRFTRKARLHWEVWHYCPACGWTEKVDETEGSVQPGDTLPPSSP